MSHRVADDQARLRSLRRWRVSGCGQIHQCAVARGGMEVRDGVHSQGGERALRQVKFTELALRQGHWSVSREVALCGR